jgi:hypothetical protein
VDKYVIGDNAGIRAQMGPKKRQSSLILALANQPEQTMPRTGFPLSAPVAVKLVLKL